MFLNLIIFIAGLIIGWQLAHQEVATECERQGSFYVGSKTFKCTEIKESE